MAVMVVDEFEAPDGLLYKLLPQHLTAPDLSAAQPPASLALICTASPLIPATCWGVANEPEP